MQINKPAIGLGRILKEKWRNKTDEYRKKKRKMRQLKSGSSSSCAVPKGAFFDQMVFLDPFIEDKE